MSKKTFHQRLLDEAEGIRKEIGPILGALCTEQEAGFTLLRLAEQMRVCPTKEPRKIREKEIAKTRELVDLLKTFQWMAERGVERNRWVNIFLALESCHPLGFPVPEWAIKGLIEAAQWYRNGKVLHMEEAFGAKRPKNYRQAKVLELSEMSLDIYARCRQLQDAGVKIAAPEYGGGLFKTVGKEYGMSSSKVRDYYYMYDRLIKSKIGKGVQTRSGRGG